MIAFVYGHAEEAAQRRIDRRLRPDTLRGEDVLGVALGGLLAAGGGAAHHLGRRLERRIDPRLGGSLLGFETIDLGLQRVDRLLHLLDRILELLYLRIRRAQLRAG